LALGNDDGDNDGDDDVGDDYASDDPMSLSPSIQSMM